MQFIVHLKTFFIVIPTLPIHLQKAINLQIFFTSNSIAQLFVYQRLTKPIVLHSKSGCFAR